MGSYSINNLQILKDVFDTVLMFSLDQCAVKVEAHKITEGCHPDTTEIRTLDTGMLKP